MPFRSKLAGSNATVGSASALEPELVDQDLPRRVGRRECVEPGASRARPGP